MGNSLAGSDSIRHGWRSHRCGQTLQATTWVRSAHPSAAACSKQQLCFIGICLCRSSGIFSFLALCCLHVRCLSFFLKFLRHLSLTLFGQCEMRACPKDSRIEEPLWRPETITTNCWRMRQRIWQAIW